MGLKEALNARHVCNLAGIPTYTSPEKAVKAFMHMVDYQRVQALLHEIPPSLPFSTSPEIRAECRALIKQAKEQAGRHSPTLKPRKCWSLRHSYRHQRLCALARRGFGGRRALSGAQGAESGS